MILFRIFVFLSPLQKLRRLKYIKPVVLYGCETWSLIHSKGRTQRVFENGVLRRITGPMRKERVGGWRRLYEELHNLYTSPNIIGVSKSRRMR
jgi:hypothetical protein